MIALLYLKRPFNWSDEGVDERWGEIPTWRFLVESALHRSGELQKCIQRLEDPLIDEQKRHQRG